MTSPRRSIACRARATAAVAEPWECPPSRLPWADPSRSGGSASPTAEWIATLRETAATADGVVISGSLGAGRSQRGPRRAAAHLQAGRGRRFGPFKPKVLKDARLALGTVRVDGSARLHPGSSDSALDRRSRRGPRPRGLVTGAPPDGRLRVQRTCQPRGSCGARSSAGSGDAGPTRVVADDRPAAAPWPDSAGWASVGRPGRRCRGGTRSRAGKLPGLGVRSRSVIGSPATGAVFAAIDVAT
jgi:hypothetical protein